MKAFPVFSHLQGARRKGVALITVVSVLALATVLVLALFSATESEFKSTRSHTYGALGKLQADSAVNIVIGQIQSASHQDNNTTGMETWSSQPGMVRQYREDGTLLHGYKLYSDSKMVANSETEIAADTPPTDWDKRPDQYVDMNEPVIRYDTSGSIGARHVYFPIVDPRAYSKDPTHSVEGFSYSNYTNGLSGSSLDGVVLPDGSVDGGNQRVPMPVEWLYVLKDGTVGYLDNSKKFVGAAGQRASIDNPIVSRMGFWTDDESCKININTAGEGTYWDTPRLYHERDGEWARFQPMTYEYQRYPGHPATVCMSTVLFPGQDMNPLVSDTANFNKALKYKETIYDLMPKILPGGSRAGSVLVPAGHNFTPTDFREVQKALGERLFASADEFLLRGQVGGNGERDEIDLGNEGMWSGMKRADVIERLRPFLTTRSRSSETNPFGLPKICMWPLHRTNSSDYRTVFDQTIAYCSQFAGRDYFFTRSDCTSQDELSKILRNKQLFTYLQALTRQPIPGFGMGKATFLDKYGDNLEQILVEMFDYIRSTNLYDETIAEKSVGPNPPITGLPTARQTAYTDGMRSKTFTPMRNSTGSSFPGHGQVTPTVLPKGKDEVYRGMGRFLTISEIGLQFICCAEGSTTPGGPPAPKITPKTPPAAAKYTPPTWSGDANSDFGVAKNWYSNFPPLSAGNQDPSKGFYQIKYPTSSTLEGIGAKDASYPGYKSTNWNWCLEKDTPLPANTKRVQASFLMEWFCPSTGWSLINPDLQLEVDASQLKVNGRPLFPMNGGKVVVKPYAHMSNAWGVYMRGGTISYRAFLQGRKLPGARGGSNGFTKGNLLDDVSYTAYTSKTGILKDCIQYNLVSDFFDVPSNGGITMTGGTVIVRILPGESPGVPKVNPPAMQIFNFKFPSATFPAPILATKSENTTWGQNFDGSWWVKHPVPAPYWWSFNADGGLGRNSAGARVQLASDPDFGGRYRFIGNEIGSYGNTPSAGEYYRGNLAIPDDTIQSLVLRHGDPRLTMGQYNVPDTEFEPHRFYGQQRLAHNLVLANWSDGPGLDRGEDKKGWRLVKDANYNNSYLPDHPYSAACGAGLQKYGDFDRGITNQTDGAYINKPDEGNSYGIISSSTGEQSVPYFTDPWVSWLAGAAYFSPNRQVPSPGMFGSLPTGVHESGGSSPGCRREPWRTLLFRPQTWSSKLGQQYHIGAPKVLKGYSSLNGLNNHGVDPADYLLMDFFWMPVVEPYAISEPGSTAGKINMNYQMAPFRHIRRATGLAAVLKSEEITAVPVLDANVYLSRPGGAPSNQAQTWFWKEDNSSAGRKFWHRQIDVEATLKLFDERFRSGFAFISPAQICEMYLLPKKQGSADTLVPEKWGERISDVLKTSGTGSILKFWEDNGITAENLKEKPYTDMYPRLTTRSNTYLVHLRVQTIKKARATDPAKFVEGSDAITSEYRGSAVVERYLDLADPELAPSKNLDYATTNPTSKPSLETFARFRIISQKRFDP